MTKERFEENRSWMEQGAWDATTGNCVLCFQSYVVKTPHHNILVDACIGNNKTFPLRPSWNGKQDGNWMAALKAANLAPEDIDFVMCTHLHGDHVGWNTKLENGRWVPTFPKARYLFAKQEFDYWSEQNAKAPVPPFVDSVLPVVEPSATSSSATTTRSAITCASCRRRATRPAMSPSPSAAARTTPCSPAT